MTDHVLPVQDLDAEATVLSAAVLSPELADEALSLLAPDGSDFYSNANRWIWQAIAGLTETGQHVDIVAVAGWLRSHTPRDSDTSLLNAAGGTTYLAQVVDATPGVAHVEQHARRVLNLARQRRLQQTLGILRAEAQQEHPEPERWIETVESRVYEATASESLGVDSWSYRELVEPAMRETRELSQGTRSFGIPIGIGTLDAHLLGWQPGWLVYIAARPGIGKTAFVQGSIEHSAERGWYWHYFSLEMTRRELRERSIARHAGIPINALATGRLTGVQWAAYASAVERLSKLPIRIDDSSTLTPARMRAKTRRAFAKARTQEVKLGGIVIDHVQLTECDDPRGKNPNERLTLVSKSLKQLAKDHNCVVLALSQLSRPMKGSKVGMPTLADLRDSGSLEQDADVVLGIHRQDEYIPPGEPKTGEALIGVLKGRSRGSDTHECRFDGPTTRFYSESEEDTWSRAESAMDDDIAGPPPHWSDR